MTRLTGVILSDDQAFTHHMGDLLRAGSIPVRIIPRDGASPDVVIVDGRDDPGAAMQRVERVRAASPAAAVFMVALEASPDLILQSMRAGANEFLTWPPPADTLDQATRRTAARRTSTSDDQPESKTVAFFGAKGGVGTTTVAVNCAVELARLSKRSTLIVDVKPGLGEISLFLGIRSRYSLVDALDNMHRLDSDFLAELVVKHKSGVEILAGSDRFDRPGQGDATALEEVFRLLSRQYEYILIDAGNEITPCSIAALYSADMVCLVANPDVPSVRNAQRVLEHIKQLGTSPDRIRVLLNRAAEPFPIAPVQIETALGHPIDQTFPSDYRVVSAALNSGVPLALTGNTELASQFDRFTRRILDPEAETPVAAGRRGPLRLDRLVSLW